MRKWLVTTSSEQDLDALRRDVAAEGGSVIDSPPVPLDPEEQVLEVDGPDDLPSKLERYPSVRKVSPNSEIDLF